jgi:hypothetical protein
MKPLQSLNDEELQADLNAQCRRGCGDGLRVSDELEEWAEEGSWPVEPSVATSE